MMKVHSSALALAVETIGEAVEVPRVRALHPARSKPRPFTFVVTDGPFAESKESCLHVAIIAQRMKDEDSPIRGK
jgi:hypothetical protein